MEAYIAAYQSAREELLERIKLRDQNLVAYLATVGAILGFAFHDGTTASKQIIYMAIIALPLISLVFSSIVLNHHFVVGKIGEYIVTELSTPASLSCWDTSKTRNLATNSQLPRAISQGLLLTFPSIYCVMFLIITWPATKQEQSDKFIFLFALALNVGIGVVIAAMNLSNARRRIQSENQRTPFIPT